MPFRHHFSVEFSPEWDIGMALADEEDFNESVVGSSAGGTIEDLPGLTCKGSNVSAVLLVTPVTAELAQLVEFGN